MPRHVHRAAMVAALLVAVPVSAALAQRGHGRSGGGAPHAMPHAAPAPHVSAAPHMAAPHFAAPPHVAAAPHMAAPHRAAPHMTPRMAPHVAPHIASHHFAPPARHMAAPHGGAPHFAASHGGPHHAPPHIAAGRGGPHGGGVASNHSQRPGAGHAARELSRHAGKAPAAETHAREHAGSNTPGKTAGRQRPGLNGHETVGQRPAGAKKNLAGSHENETGANAHQAGPRENQAGVKGHRGEMARGEQSHHQPRRAPIIRNPVFASQQASRRERRGERGEALSQSTFRGRFTQSALYDHRDRHRHHHHLGIVLGFVGPLFWPYAYSDFVDYTYSPYAYDTFWPYAFDDVYAGIYGGYAPESYASGDAYAYAGSSGSEQVYDRATNQTVGNAAPSSGAERICSGQAQGLTDFSIQKIADQVEPDQKQQELLDALKAATLQAVDILQQACPTELPSTPTGRLAAMRTRVDAMLKAVETVRPALDAFYQSLSDEQRERFVAVDQSQQATGPRAGADLNHLCQGQIPAKSDLPTDRIERTLHLGRDQEDKLKALDQATLDSARILQAKCQPDQTLTPTGRLAEMQHRLQAMSKALETTQNALDDFYGSLSDEQKARFDRMKVRAS